MLRTNKYVPYLLEFSMSSRVEMLNHPANVRGSHGTMGRDPDLPSEYWVLLSYPNAMVFPLPPKLPWISKLPKENDNSRLLNRATYPASFSSKFKYNCQTWSTSIHLLGQIQVGDGENLPLTPSHIFS